MTFSIVARDPVSGRIGVAVATCHLAVGGMVPHIHAPAGAVASQADSNPLHGVNALRLMGRGAGAGGALSAEAALKKLREGDERAEHRQVHAVDTMGGAAAWTGDDCVDFAGHKVYRVSGSPGASNEAFSVAGNMLDGPRVLEEMARSFLRTRGSERTFEDRMLLALEAGDAAGGDKRGRMSAALRTGAIDQPYCDTDLRVDHHPEPLVELRRLYAERRKEYAASFYDTRPREDPPPAATTRTSVAASRPSRLGTVLTHTGAVLVLVACAFAIGTKVGAAAATRGASALR